MKLQQYLINESINDKGILHAVFMGGTPGSGKSYVISKITSGQIEPRIVNTDTWTEFLKVGGDNETWFKYADKTKQLTKNQLSLYLNSMLPLWIDGTSTNPSNLFKREGIVKSLGYDTAMIWVTTSLKTALKRAKEREERIGRHVDADFIETTHKKSEMMKNYYKSSFNTFMEINNDDGELTDKIILKAFKKISKFYTQPVRNPIGIELIEKMRSEGHKYLIDTEMFDMSDIKKLVNTWYRK